MKITNNLGFPGWLHDVLKWCFGQYARGSADFTVTELASPVQQRALQKKHDADIVQDISQIVDLVIGKAVHLFFETALLALRIEYIEFERRLNGTYKVGGKMVTLSGQFDAYDTKERVLWDFKVVKAYAAKMGPKADYIAQLNAYANLIRQSGQPGPLALKNLYIIKDWSADDAVWDPEYPKAPLVIIDIPLMTQVESDAWIVARMVAHAEGSAQCSSEETWERPGKYAAIKKGAARASKLFDPEQKADAETYAKKGKMDLTFRPGRRLRCERCCSAAPFCPQQAEFLKQVEAA